MGWTSALSLCAALALGAGVGCGSKAKGPEQPGQTAGGEPGQNPEDILPDGFTPPGAGDGFGDDVGDTGAFDTGDGAPDASQRDLRPPGLDLPPAERRARVAAHVKKAERALAGQRKDADQAIAEARAALAVDETSVEAMLILAHANYIKGYLDLAEDILDKARERGGANHRELHFLFGLIYERTDREDRAVGAYERAIAVDPNYQSALLNLGVHYLRSKRHEQATAIFERLTSQLGMNTAVAWNNLASAYRGRSADFAASNRDRRNELLLRAETTYKRAIAASKDYAPAYYNLGLLYLDADPFPTPRGDMDRLARLKRAKTYFDEYRRKPGADGKRADEQANLAQTLHDQEATRRKRIEEAERRAREAEERAKKVDDTEVEWD